MARAHERAGGAAAVERPSLTPAPGPFALAGRPTRENYTSIAAEDRSLEPERGA
jgi:hypothetical protein